jgi:nucleoid-associated protein YgaU
MARVLAIIGLVGLLTATGVAGASPADQVRLPVSVAPPSEPEPDSTSASVVVAKGDHLWKISARHLGPDASNGEVAPYWLEVIDVNTPTLRSGDPDLIFPGEVVQLPTIPERP